LGLTPASIGKVEQGLEKFVWKAKYWDYQEVKVLIIGCWVTGSLELHSLAMIVAVPGQKGFTN
jgi:hypothetical protein